jgi:Xaa-Pro aminopeptidase
MAVKPNQYMKFGPTVKDYMEGINVERMRKERLARAQARMKKEGVAAAILAGPDFRYTTGLRTPMFIGSGAEQFAVVFAESDETVVFQQSQHAKQNRILAPWIKSENFRPVPFLMPGVGPEGMKVTGPKAADFVYEALREKKVEKELVGYSPLHGPMKDRLESRGVKLTPAGGFMNEVRMIKTRDEIECLRWSAAMVDKAWWAMYESIKPGMRDRELSAIGAKVLIEEGAEGPFYVSVRGGIYGSPNFMGMITDRMMQYGDLCFCDIWGAMYLGYRSCYYRTWKVGCKPTAKEKEWYKKAYDELMESCDAIKPGLTTADIAKHFRPPSHYGWKEEIENYGDSLGHGLGLTQHDMPWIQRNVSFDAPVVLEENMTLAMETWYGEDGVGGCRIENVGVVTKNGFENFYRMPDEGILIPPNQIVIDPVI